MAMTHATLDQTISSNDSQKTEFDAQFDKEPKVPEQRLTYTWICTFCIG